MSRIRTVKPELFKHEGLFAAEAATKLPLRLAFIGLFTCCDKKGCFKWRPLRLKVDILPYDEVDADQIFDALLKHGFIKKYQYQGEWYGYIPTWSKHQCVNHREATSDIPLYSCSLVVGEVQAASDAILVTADQIKTADNVVKKDDVATIFAHWKQVMHYPEAKLDHKRQQLINNALNLGYQVEQLCQAINGCNVTPHNIGVNPAGQRYDGLNIILRDAEQIDRFINNYYHPPQRLRAVDQQLQGNLLAMQNYLSNQLKDQDISITQQDLLDEITKLT